MGTLEQPPKTSKTGCWCLEVLLSTPLQSDSVHAGSAPQCGVRTGHMTVLPTPPREDGVH